MRILAHQSSVEVHEAFVRAEEISAVDRALEQSTVTSPSESLVHVQGDMPWGGHVCFVIAVTEEAEKMNRMVNSGFII